MDSINYVVKKVLDAIRNDLKKKTTGYDATGIVKRIEGDTAWVHFDGGVPETPVAKSINCKKGDKVRVRNSGGTPFLVGNDSAPPTDDTKAEHAQTTAEVAEKAAEDAQTTASEAQETAEHTSNYFWHIDGSGAESGAHVTEVPQAEFQANPSGGNLLMQAAGIYVRKGLQKFAQFLASGLTIYSGNGTTIAHLGYGAGKDSGGGTSDAPYYDLGYRNTANGIGNYSTAEGYDNSAENYCSHAEGYQTQTEGYCGHAEGYKCYADGYAAHAEGDNCHAYGGRSHAEGSNTTADAAYSHAEGYNTYAAYNYQHVCGKYNDYNSRALFQVGNGTSTSNRKNAFEAYEDGSIRAATETVSIASSDFTTTTGSISSVEMKRFGNVVQLTMQVTNTLATAAGSNHFAGTLNLAAYRPLVPTECASYSGSVCVIGVINTDGSIIARVVGAQLPANRTPRLTFTYLI